MIFQNSKQLPILSATEKTVGVLRSQFPVSSGNQHRLKELEWVPVEKTTPAAVAATTTTTTSTAKTLDASVTVSETSTPISTTTTTSTVADPVFPKPVLMVRFC